MSSERADWLMEADAYKLGKAMGKADRERAHPFTPDGPFVQPGPNHAAYSQGYKAAWAEHQYTEPKETA